MHAFAFAQSSCYFCELGYSWKTNQYGLTIDTVTAFEVVLPNGSVKVVTEEDEDLWFALRVSYIPTVTLSTVVSQMTQRED